MAYLQAGFVKAACISASATACPLPGSERELGEVLPNGVSSEVARNKLAHWTV